MDGWMDGCCTYACMYVCMYVFMYVCMYVCLHVYICICTYIHIYIYIYIYIYALTSHAAVHSVRTQSQNLAPCEPCIASRMPCLCMSMSMPHTHTHTHTDTHKHTHTHTHRHTHTQRERERERERERPRAQKHAHERIALTQHTPAVVKRKRMPSLVCISAQSTWGINAASSPFSMMKPRSAGAFCARMCGIRVTRARTIMRGCV